MNFLKLSFKKMYDLEVKKRLKHDVDFSVVREKDIKHLPEPVQKYLRYVGVVGKSKIHNFKVISSGSMKMSPKSNWIKIKSEQHNFFNNIARLFYIKSSLYGVPFEGLHMYVGSSAKMKIKVAYLFQVVDAKGKKMNQSENVTLFNDMCLFAPASLINKNIQWESVDKLTAKAKFTHNNITISAILLFNQKGELINFISDDRYLSSDGKTYKNYRWSTPIKKYEDFDGRKIQTYGEAIWHTPQGDFTYAKFYLDEIKYNLSDSK